MDRDKNFNYKEHYFKHMEIKSHITENLIIHQKNISLQ
jgi:hypothetical protein